METIIFGGTFDPPTSAHEAVMRACLARQDTDEVWVMPSGARLDKPGMASDEQRLAMLGLLKAACFAAEPRLKVSDFELRLPRPTETSRTVTALRTAYPGRRFRFVFGADSYQSMPAWEGGRQLRRSLPVLLIPRAGFGLPAESALVRYLELSGDNDATISSTAVRRLAAEGADLEGLVHQLIARHIGRSGLYNALQ